MIDPVTATAAPPTVFGRPATDPPPSRPPASSAPGEDATPHPPASPRPLSLDVEQGQDGVFVYTLSDPATGAVVAVIPREDVRLDRDGRNLDRRV